MKHKPTPQFIIAIAFILFSFYIFRMVLLKEVKATETTTITIISNVTNIIMLIVGFYFGSSSGSKQKDAMLGSDPNTTKNEKSQ